MREYVCAHAGAGGVDCEVAWCHEPLSNDNDKKKIKSIGR